LRALARQIRAWSKGALAIREDDMVQILRDAACEMLDKERDE